MEDCPFCHIAAGEATAAVLYDDGETIAFLDAHPATRGHTLVAPTVHLTDLMTADDPTASSVFRTARTVADALDSVLDSDGFSVFHTTGDLVGSVEHAHVHLLPRDRTDDISLSLNWRSLEDDSEGPRRRGAGRTRLTASQK